MSKSNKPGRRVQIVPGMRIMDLDHPPSWGGCEGVVIATGPNGAAYRWDDGQLSIVEWDCVAICATQPGEADPPLSPDDSEKPRTPEPASSTSAVDRLGEIFAECLNDAELVNSLLEAFDECGRLPGNLAMRAILSEWGCTDDHEQRAEALHSAVSPKWERPFVRTT